MLTVAVPKRNKLQNIIVLTPKDGPLIRLEEPANILDSNQWRNSSSGIKINRLHPGRPHDKIVL